MVNTHSTMELKKRIAKKILEAKLNKATTHAQAYIQKLQQQLDDLINKVKDNE
jgi:uncharacterized coiled-coil protein SlyX